MTTDVQGELERYGESVPDHCGGLFLDHGTFVVLSPRTAIGTSRRSVTDCRVNVVAIVLEERFYAVPCCFVADASR